MKIEYCINETEMFGVYQKMLQHIETTDLMMKILMVLLGIFIVFACFITWKLYDNY